MEKPSLIEMLAVAEKIPERLLGIFVKEPVAGRVKTRLCPPLQPEEAAQLYQIATQETVSRFVGSGIRAVLFYDGSSEYFQRHFPTLPLLPQAEGGLGQRMSVALSSLLETGCKAAALIGSDSPDLPIAQVEDAFSALAAHDVVTIPADDGGYVLIGQAQYRPEIFDNIPWSTSEVMTTTRRRAAEHGISFRECGGWVDVDDRDTLQKLLQRSPESATAIYIRQNLAHRLELAE